MKRFFSPEYKSHESLDSLCDDALILSKDHYSEHNIAGLLIRFATASWHTRSGGTALLKNRSIQLGSHELNKRPTSLEIYEHPAERVMALTRFAFNASTVEDIQIFKLVMPVHDALSHGRLNQKHLKDLQDELQQSHLTEPTTADMQTFYDELARGASGLHTEDSETLARL